MLLPLLSIFNGTAFPSKIYFKKKLQRSLSMVKRSLKLSKLTDMVPSSFNFPIVEDHIVIELVKSEILRTEKEGQSWIIEGFPRTKVQALSLQKIGVIPDKFILLEVKRSTAVTRVKNNMIANNSTLYGTELDDAAALAIDEYELHIKGVQSAFKGFIYDYNAIDKAQNDVANDLARMLRLRCKSGAPRRPPRVILLGPPGSGRSTQSQLIAKKYGLTHICTRSLLKDEI